MPEYENILHQQQRARTMQTLPPNYGEPIDIYTTPIRVSNLLSEAAELFRRAPFYFIFLATIIQAPAIFAKIIVPRLMVYYGYANTFVAAGLSILYYFWGLLSSVITILVVTKVVAREYFSFHEILDEYFKRIIPALLTQLWVGIITTFLMIFIIPGIIVSNNLVFTLPITVTRGISGKKAMEMSEKMVEGRWLKVFGINLVPALIGIFLNYSLLYLAGWFFGNRFFFITLIGAFMQMFWNFVMVYSTLFFLKLENSLKPVDEPQSMEQA